MAQFELRCRENGFALTVQRRAVLEAVMSREDHPTADQIYEDVQRRIPDISRTTVYRVLDMLVQIGVIGKPSHLGSATRYEPNVHRHHHLVCTACGGIADLEDQGGAIDVAAVLGDTKPAFNITDYSIHFHGICGKCAEAARTREEPAV